MKAHSALTTHIPYGAEHICHILIHLIDAQKLQNVCLIIWYNALILFLDRGSTQNIEADYANHGSMFRSGVFIAGDVQQYLLVVPSCSYSRIVKACAKLSFLYDVLQTIPPIGNKRLRLFFREPSTSSELV